MRFLSVVGARPQFIKAAPLCAALRREHGEFLVHTGQHYDDNMSAVFLRELNLPTLDRHLGVGSGSHGRQTGAMLERIEQVLEEVRPEIVIVYGDTNSTLAGVLAAAKMHIPVAHVEAGLRSYNREIPEELNRVVADHLSRWLFAPSQVSVDQLAAEGICDGVYEVGDIMADCVRYFRPLAQQRSDVLERLGLRPGEYCVATVHRAGNTDHPARLASILEGLHRVPLPVVFPVHPRTTAAIGRHHLDSSLYAPGARSQSTGQGNGLVTTAPLGYFDMLQLQEHAAVIITDSGGIQKEAYYHGVPCVTLREETEWVETVDVGWNRLVGVDPAAIAEAVRQYQREVPDERPTLYGDGRTTERIVKVLCG